MDRWIFRCLPGFSTILLLALLGFAFVDLSEIVPSVARRFLSWPPHRTPFPEALASPPSLTLSQKFYIFYTFLVHLDTTGFALRLCLALVLVKGKIKQTLKRRQVPLPEGFPQDVSEQNKNRSSQSPPPPYSLTSSPISPSSPVSKHHLSPASEVVHAIIIPNYAEDIDTLRSTLMVLASHPRSLTQYEVSTII